VHSLSRIYWNQPADRSALAAKIRSRLEMVESREGHDRSLVVGDFNSDPFDDALTNSESLHAVATRELALQEKRVVDGEDRKFLYNPMWGLFGDNTPGPAGSYFYRVATSSCRFWHMFDQVLLRPQLLTAFDSSSLQILTKVGEKNLAQKMGRPNKEEASDHFPIIFSLNLLAEFPNV
jgi:hypothetical protein